MKQFLAVLVFAGASASAETISLESGLRLLYDFNNNVLDTSGNNLNGVPIGNPGFTSDQNSNINSAIYLNGSAQWVYFPDSVFGPAVQAFTFHARVHLDGNSSGKIIMKGSENGEAQLEIRDGMINFGIKNYNWFFASGNASNGWHNLIGTYFKNSNILLYIDGALINQTTIPESDLNSGGYNYSAIGANAEYVGSSEYFNGIIDEVRIYDRALNTSEIQALGVPEPSALSLGSLS